MVSMKSLKIKLKYGFTLIELLVVISIISLLSSVVVTATQSARKQATESKIMSEIVSIQTALELYKADVGKYPGTWNGNGTSWSELDPPTYAGFGEIGRDCYGSMRQINSLLENYLTGIDSMDETCHLYTGTNNANGSPGIHGYYYIIVLVYSPETKQRLLQKNGPCINAGSDFQAFEQYNDGDFDNGEWACYSVK